MHALCSLLNSSKQDCHREACWELLPRCWLRAPSWRLALSLSELGSTKMSSLSSITPLTNDVPLSGDDTPPTPCLIMTLSLPPLQPEEGVCPSRSAFPSSLSSSSSSFQSLLDPRLFPAATALSLAPIPHLAHRITDSWGTGQPAFYLLTCGLELYLSLCLPSQARSQEVFHPFVQAGDPHPWEAAFRKWS